MTRIHWLARAETLVALALPISFAACSDAAAEHSANAGGGSDPGADVGDGGTANGNASDDAGRGGPSGTGNGSDAGTSADGSAITTGGPATPNGKLDALCHFSSDPSITDGLLVVDPSGKRIAYPRLTPGANMMGQGDIVLRDLETNKVTVLGSMGSCTGVQWAGAAAPQYSTDNPVSWMQSTPYGLLFADASSALHLVDWTGAEKAKLAIAGHAWKTGEVRSWARAQTAFAQRSSTSSATRRAS